MWQRWLRDLSVELNWMKRDILRRWRLDTPIGILGMIMLISGLLLFVVIGGGFAKVFRTFVPWVSGSRVGEVYWQSIGFGLKTSFLFLLFSGSLIIFFVLKFFERR